MNPQIATRANPKPPLPPGTIRTHGGVRRVKVRLDGRIQDRWMDFARWWWIHNRGPVPQGKRVGHVDGDKLNDDPANLALVTAADVVALWHERDPEGSAANFTKLRAATAECNRCRAAIRRAHEFLPTCWYAVDLDRRLIMGQPRRQRWQVYRDFGVEVTAGNWRSVRPASLGWPGLHLLGACTLAALADGPLHLFELPAGIHLLREQCGWKRLVLTRAVFYPVLHSLKHRGWIERLRGRNLRAVYAITPAALMARTRPCLIVPLRGRELGWPPFDQFTRLPEGEPIHQTPATPEKE